MINLYVADKIGRKSFEDSKILKNVWESDGWLLFTATEVGDLCLEVPMEHTKKCLNAGDLAKDPKSEELFRRYVAALKNGYTKDFSAFVKESKLMGYANIGMQVLAGLFAPKDVAPDLKDEENAKKNRQIGMWVGISLAVVTAGVVTYFVIKSKKD